MLPGATTSGLMRPSYVGPRELKYASRLGDAKNGVCRWSGVRGWQGASDEWGAGTGR